MGQMIVYGKQAYLGESQKLPLNPNNLAIRPLTLEKLNLVQHLNQFRKVCINQLHKKPNLPTHVANLTLPHEPPVTISGMTAVVNYMLESASERDVIIEVRNVSVTFDMDRGESRVLDDITFDIYDNEIVGVVGESGSGKSMFASALLDAVVDPGQVTGEITYYPPDGEPVSVLELSKEKLRQFRWDQVSMVFQGALSAFNPTRDVKTHFIETIKAHGYDLQEGMDRAQEILTDLHLDANRILSSYPHELSGGMKQRTLIALSLVLDPEVLVMDEPTAALDLLMQQSILHLLSEIQEKYDITMVFITHDLPLVAELANRLAVMYAFEFIEVGPMSEIRYDPAHPYTRALLKAVPSLDAPVEEMRSIDGSSPDPVNVPSGCSYHPRCPLSDDHCINVDPDFRSPAEDHRVACHYWEQAEAAVPLTVAQQQAKQASTASDEEL